MTTFVEAVNNQSERTTNGMKAYKTTGDACVSLFFKIGAMRGKNVIPEFTAAFVENPEYAVRIALWTRDIRGGAGERKLFRDILNHLVKMDENLAIKLLAKIPELGRFDDLLDHSNETNAFRKAVVELISGALREKNGLAAKWLPRKGATAAKLRNNLGMTPKEYRKTLVNLTKVVESQMCAKDWDNINFNHVPSVASARYRKAFKRNAPKAYEAWSNALASGDPEAKVNAAAVYPYDVIKGNSCFSSTEQKVVIAQWDALPNYVGDASILPMVDVSGSMYAPIGGHKSKTDLQCIDVAVSLGLYLADKNKGKFNGTFLTFSGNPELIHMKGNIIQKLDQLRKADWGYDTNLHKAFEKILETAVNGNVPKEEMPEIVLILSDMQFNSCVKYDDRAIDMIRRKYNEAGYNVPKIVFWNINSYDNVPVKFDEKGTALVSGFSPAIVKSVLKANFEQFTPEAIMLQTIMNERYNF